MEDNPNPNPIENLLPPETVQAKPAPTQAPAALPPEIPKPKKPKQPKLPGAKSPNKGKKGSKPKAAILIAEGNSITETAATLNLHRDTITKWMKTDPDFVDLIQSTRDDLCREAQGGTFKRVEQAWKVYDQFMELELYRRKELPKSALDAALAILRTVGAIGDYVKPMGNSLNETPQVDIPEPIKTQEGTLEQLNPPDDDSETIETPIEDDDDDEEEAA